MGIKNRVITLIFLWAGFSRMLLALANGVYIQDMGQADKSMPPVVFASNRPCDSTLRQFFGEHQWTETRIFYVPPLQLEKIIAAFRTLFEKNKTGTQECQSDTFTFKVILVEGEGDKITTRIFASELFNIVLTALMEERERRNSKGFKSFTL
ncbi:MAG: hypothetical protein GTO45_14545 [Candidatus Aminicenantes bacterium]|nr:hypothetical protein [Candidatus Aminicenantes bacterium]NIM80738.1 hypothetical protein [Candidatus Aminicenantes bacterium]NIN19326.1 hypothetical protein [Candidatus Aminicenantes bacterium]NIN43228.1 hypothetical protein [Candidatus Aminicenantes bacterium]NIN85967.1 hypothetical protein [Candidatus Aminicenantes bacterium]